MTLHVPSTLLSQALAGQINRADFDAWCSKERLEQRELFNELALSVAREFTQNRLPYPKANVAVSAVYTLMVEEFAERGNGYEFAQPALAIYEAFDAGEVASDDVDPVETNTRPLLSKILTDHPAPRKDFHKLTGHRHQNEPMEFFKCSQCQGILLGLPDSHIAFPDPKNLNRTISYNVKRRTACPGCGHVWYDPSSDAWSTSQPTLNEVEVSDWNQYDGLPNPS